MDFALRALAFMEAHPEIVNSVLTFANKIAESHPELLKHLFDRFVKPEM